MMPSHPRTTRPVRSRTPTSAILEPLERRLALAVFTVTTHADNSDTPVPGSLRKAILDASSSQGADVIVFDQAFFSTPRTITLDKALPQLNGDVSIVGPGPSLLTVRRNPDVPDVFGVFVSFANPVSLSGMTVTGGIVSGSGGGLQINGAAPTATLDNMVFTGNSAGEGGGAVSLTNNSALTVRNSTFSANSASRGGAISFLQRIARH